MDILNFGVQQNVGVHPTGEDTHKVLEYFFVRLDTKVNLKFDILRSKFFRSSHTSWSLSFGF